MAAYRLVKDSGHLQADCQELEHSNSRFDSIRYVNRFESIRFVKKSTFRFTSCYAVYALNK